MAIISFKDRRARLIADAQHPGKGFPANLINITQRKLDALDAAIRLTDLEIPPGNRLEALRGDRSGQHSIRINAQFRICFVWTERGPSEVEIVDYH